MQLSSWTVCHDFVLGCFLGVARLVETYFSFSLLAAPTASFLVYDGDLAPCQMYKNPVLTLSNKKDVLLRRFSAPRGTSIRHISFSSSFRTRYSRYAPWVLVSASSRLPMWTMVWPSKRFRKHGGSFPWETRTWKNLKTKLWRFFFLNS